MPLYLTIKYHVDDITDDSLHRLSTRVIAGAMPFPANPKTNAYGYSVSIENLEEGRSIALADPDCFNYEIFEAENLDRKSAKKILENGFIGSMVPFRALGQHSDERMKIVRDAVDGILNSHAVISRGGGGRRFINASAEFVVLSPKTGDVSRVCPEACAAERAEIAKAASFPVFAAPAFTP